MGQTLKVELGVPDIVELQTHGHTLNHWFIWQRNQERTMFKFMLVQQSTEVLDFKLLHLH